MPLVLCVGVLATLFIFEEIGESVRGGRWPSIEFLVSTRPFPRSVNNLRDQLISLQRNLSETELRSREFLRCSKVTIR